jgi:hypothetical protein
MDAERKEHALAAKPWALMRHQKMDDPICHASIAALARHSPKKASNLGRVEKNLQVVGR